MVSILRPKAALALAILAVLGLLIYANAIGHPFVHDDVVFILQNPNIARWDNIIQAFFDPGIPFQGLKITTPYYRPILEVMYRLQFAVFGANAWGFHLVNVLVHILNGFLVFCAVRLVMDDRRSKLGAGQGASVHEELPWAPGDRYQLTSGLFALLVALLFLAHPLQSEAVACVSGISNLLVAFFLLGAFVQYARVRLVTGKARTAALILSLLSFAAALFTKEQAVIFPLFLVVYEATGIRRAGGPGLMAAAGRAVLFFTLAAGYMLWRSHLFPNHFGAVFANSAELWLRVSVIPKTVLMYLGLIMWPSGLHYYRSVDILAPAGWAWPVLAAHGACMTWLFLRTPRSARMLAVLGMAWGGLFLLPGLNIVPLINEYSLVLAAEHFLYLSLAGFLAAFGAFALGGILKVPARIAAAGVVVVICVFSVLTVRQNVYWRGEVPLFERTLQFEPGLGRVHFLLAKAYVDERRLPEALRHYTQGLLIMEDYVRKSRLSDARGSRGAASAVVVYQQYVKAARQDRGQVLLMMGDLERSNYEFRAALAAQVDGPASMERLFNDSRTANNLALNLLRMGRMDEARRWWQAAVRIAPQNADALNNLGMLALQRGDRVAAQFFFQKALKFSPGSVSARRNLERLGK